MVGLTGLGLPIQLLRCLVLNGGLSLTNRRRAKGMQVQMQFQTRHRIEHGEVPIKLDLLLHAQQPIALAPLQLRLRQLLGHQLRGATDLLLQPGRQLLQAQQHRLLAAGCGPLQLLLHHHPAWGGEMKIGVDANASGHEQRQPDQHRHRQGGKASR